MTKKKIDIPKGWKCTKLGNLGQFLKGKGIAKSEVMEDGIPCVRYGEIYTNHNDYIKAFTSFTTQESANQSTKLEYGDILFAGSGETLEDIGKSVAFVDEFEAYSGGDIIILRGHNQDPKFLGFLLNTDFVSRQTFQLGQGHSVVHIYSSGLKNVKIPLPPLHEQQQIATILSTLDKAIDKLTQLIAAKEQRKKGLMQQLLTGKKRFAGFTDEWKEVKLGDCSILSGDYGINAAGVEYNEGLPKYLRITDIDDSGLLKTESMVSVDSPDSHKYLLENEDIVFARTGASVGKHYVHNQNRYGSLVFAGFLIRFRLNKNILLPNFLKAYLSTSEYWNWVSIMSQRSGQPGINGKEYGILKVPIPTIHEQQKIASVLSAADKEIELLKNELERLQQQKKGLMQVLLTGEVRVKI